MICDSYPWKRQLAADADIIRRWSTKTQQTQRQAMLIERKVFLAAYTIRKLDDDYKLSTALHNRSLRCSTYPAQSKRITSLNNHKIGELYDFNRAKTETLCVRRLMDIIIHNLVFELLGDASTVEAFLVTSDRTKASLWEIKIDAFLKLMHDVANDYPPSSRFVCNPGTGQFIVWQGNGSPPASFQRQAQQILTDLTGV
jgi:hypothetical protein